MSFGVIKVKRKSPHKHTVHTKHRRYKVKNYDRGKGDAPTRRARVRRPKAPSISRKKVKRPAAKGNGFSVRVEYVDKSFEHVDVDAPTYVSALDRGIEGRKIFKEPAMIRIRRL